MNKKVRWAFLFCAAFLLFGCSGAEKKGFRIGVDPSWNPLNFYGQENAVNGYIEDLLLEISKYSGIDFVKVTANWDTLLEGIQDKRYQAALSALPPYNFNQAKYDFSKNFLALGPVLVVPAASKAGELEDMNNELVGVLAGDEAVLVLQKHPDVIMRNYASVPEALEAVVNGDVEGLLLDHLLAVTYVRDLFADTLKIVGEPLSSHGLHLVAPKGQSSREVAEFNKGLNHLIKKKKLQQLQRKWQLTY